MGTSVDASKPRSQPDRTFALSSLLLIVTLISVCFGVFVYVPGLGILLLALSAPAVIRTMLISRIVKRRWDHSMTLEGKLTTFLSSLWLAFAIGMSSFAAFAAVCFPIGLATFDLHGNSSPVAQFVFWLGWVLGAIAGIAVAVWIVMRRRTRKGHR